MEHDSLNGEADEIEVSIQYSKDGEPVSLPVVPRLTFTLQEEKEVWRLTEVTAAARVPLTDLDYLRGLRRQQDEANQGMIQMRVSMILSAETAYAAKYPDRGYTCAMATLITPEPSESQDDGGSPVADPAQVNEDWNGYRFKLSGCEGSPASKYRLLASPVDLDSDSKAFCADQSGTVKFIAGEKASACFSSGEALHSTAAPLPID